MIDTVAKAIMKWALPANDWDSLAEEQRERWREAARVAMKAMRDPTLPMLEQGQLELYNCAVHDGHGGVETSAPVGVWQAMIDEALTPADG